MIGMIGRTCGVVVAMIAPIAPIAAQGAQEAGQSGDDAAVVRLAERFAAARMAFDPVALAATLAPDFEEISPIGDVDTRTQVLGFYTADKRRPGPAMTTDQTVVRTRGDVAMVTQRVSFTPPVAGATPRSIRVRYIARRTRREWMLVSAQYTPIPPAR